jgi:hypothetical protein
MAARASRVSVESMRQHILDLCTERDIAIEWHEGRSDHAFALSELEEVHIIPIRSAVSYAIALHEVGHILGRRQRSRSTITRERWAWRWAKQNALRWTPAMEQTMRASVAWYEARSWPPIPSLKELNPRLYEDRSK